MGLKVLVTGASSGIGRGIALRFSKDGQEVFATGRSNAKLSETVKLAAKEGGGATIHTGVGDVAVEADVLRNFAEAIKALGHIDVAVLNAGQAYASPFEENTLEDFDNMFNTNVRGVFLWAKALIPVFKKQGFGQIVIINSVGGLAPIGPGFTLYSATKFALTGMAEGLRLELKGTGVKVASVFPGAVDTNIWVWDKSPEIDTRKEFALDLALLPEDVAEAVANIAYQSSRSDIDKVQIWPNYGAKNSKA